MRWWALSPIHRSHMCQHILMFPKLCWNASSTRYNSSLRKKLQEIPPIPHRSNVADLSILFILELVCTVRHRNEDMLKTNFVETGASMIKWSPFEVASCAEHKCTTFISILETLMEWDLVFVYNDDIFINPYSWNAIRKHLWLSCNPTTASALSVLLFIYHPPV